ncbi:MAG: SDR family NAD(P)-dependent oxidoreductase [Oscillospiraceae bacterium]|jgi:NAD(P)-dependent dehydrogenase (short-subunit alcohol dehydrogenase family)|nr:SDR family NAD(P)-dependent oxidoreductase [Oscillospiraceae bacterium]
MNKNVLVTGGAGGLGLAIVKKHLALGDFVWALDIVDSPGLTEVVRENKNARFIKCDISRTEYVKTALADLAASIDKLDYLHSCAGIYRREDKELLPDTILDNAAYMYDVNAVGFLRVVQVMLHTIKDGSVIMCVTSEAGSIGENWRPTEFNYCMSKAAENMACVLLQKYFDDMPQNTRIICIHPGWLRTTMGGVDALQNLENSVTPEDSAEGIVGIALDIENIPKERMYMDYKRVDIKW